MEVVQSMFFGHNGIKPEINNRKRNQKTLKQLDKIIPKQFISQRASLKEIFKRYIGF